jgi:signal peptidase II
MTSALRLPSALRSPPAICRFLLVAVGGVALDLWTKKLAFQNLELHGQAYRFIPGWLEFEAVENFGAVFGIGQGARVLFITVSVAAIFFLGYLFAASGKRPIYQILLGMLMAGVIGNLFDRVQFGYVRDMIHALPRWPHFFPYVFNVADSFLCTGVGLMVIYSFVTEQRQKTEVKRADA